MSDDSIIVKISIPSKETAKTTKVDKADTVWSVKKFVMTKVVPEIPDSYNYGFYLPGDAKIGKRGKWLEERRDIGSYLSESNTLIEFIPKTKNIDPGSLSPNSNSKKTKKKFAEDVQKGVIDKVLEKGSKSFDPNFWTENDETPLSIAVMNNNKDMITALIRCGAIIDYRLPDQEGWRTPLHIATLNNKLIAVQTLIGFGAWVDVIDAVGLTPLYYAVQNNFTDIAYKLIQKNADLEVCDDLLKYPVHLACSLNNDYLLSLLIDNGANLNVVNNVGNMPLHIASTKGAKDCVHWLLLRGADREITNKSGQTAAQLATMAGNTEIAEMIRKFTDDQIIPAPPKPQYNEDGSIVGTNRDKAIKLAKQVSSPTLDSPIGASGRNTIGRGSTPAPSIPTWNNEGEKKVKKAPVAPPAKSIAV